MRARGGNLYKYKERESLRLFSMSFKESLLTRMRKPLLGLWLCRISMPTLQEWNPLTRASENMNDLAAFPVKTCFRSSSFTAMIPFFQPSLSLRIRLASVIGYWLDIEWHWPALVNSNRLFGSKRRKIWLLVVVSENINSFRECKLFDSFTRIHTS